MNSQVHIANSQRQFLLNVNNDLRTVVVSAEVDFIAVNSLVKQYYDNFRHRAVASVLPEVEVKIEGLTCHLQYMDIFKQRVEHLVLVHEELIENQFDANFKESIFHLHVFQSLTIEMDLLKAHVAISVLLNELKVHFAEVGQVSWTDESLFSHTSAIEDVLNKTIDRFLEAGGDTSHLPIPPLTPSQVMRLNSLYSMESERIVLDWFLNSMPHGTWAELSKHYQLAINSISSERTELF